MQSRRAPQNRAPEEKPFAGTCSFLLNAVEMISTSFKVSFSFSCFFAARHLRPYNPFAINVFPIANSSGF